MNPPINANLKNATTQWISVRSRARTAGARANTVRAAGINAFRRRSSASPYSGCQGHSTSFRKLSRSWARLADSEVATARAGAGHISYETCDKSESKPGELFPRCRKPGMSMSQRDVEVAIVVLVLLRTWSRRENDNESFLIAENSPYQASYKRSHLIQVCVLLNLHIRLTNLQTHTYELSPGI
jgi:hypothetical protein